MHADRPPRATHCLRRKPPRFCPKKRRRVPNNGQALTAAERTHVLLVVNSDVNADLPICQIYARELDKEIAGADIDYVPHCVGGRAES
ncbi:hypothetical protein [Rhodococcus erythropolis]|uniref:hypothetical protein n=1 Tax=Rhodococcus erythropolis TaxID=1833 RepID=UPI001BE97AA6|nr:hypothetical protein [Rhodococcus erythropolis]MBT2266054.1 hypothetical protein [Rhodococcus erythropolis]